MLGTPKQVREVFAGSKNLSWVLVRVWRNIISVVEGGIHLCVLLDAN